VRQYSELQLPEKKKAARGRSEIQQKRLVVILGHPDPPGGAAKEGIAEKCGEHPE